MSKCTDIRGGSRNFLKQIDCFLKYGIILLVVSPTVKWTAKSVSNSNGVTTQMAMWKRIAIFLQGDICRPILNYIR